jgi:DNA-binding MarR family transcriptional regulator
MLHAALNIYASLRDRTDATVDRQELIGEVLDEVVEHSPFRMMRSMRRWPAGPLSLVHLHVLMQLAEDGPIPMRALADTLDVSQASATGIVDRMEQRALVERRRDDEDRRVIRVALTDAGRQLILGIATERRGHLTALLDEMTDEELAGFLRGSRALRRARERMHARLERARHDALDPADGVDPDATQGPMVSPPIHPGGNPASKSRPALETSR